MSTSTRESVVDDLWREKWFQRTARSIARHYVTIDAEDLAQESVFTAMRAAKTWNGEQEVQSWVKYRARRAMLSWIKQKLIEANRMRTVSIDVAVIEDGDVTLLDVAMTAPSAEDVVTADVWSTISGEVREAVEKLSPRQRKFVTSRYLQATRFGDPDHAPAGYGSGTCWSVAKRELRWMLRHHKNLIKG